MIVAGSREPRKRSPVSHSPDEHLATTTVLTILKTATKLLSELQPVFVLHGTTASRFDTLDALSRLGGQARPRDLRAAVHLSPQTLTGVLDQLEASALVRRRPNPSDRRSVLVELTSAGRDTLDRICPALIEIENDCMSILAAPDQRHLTDMLEQIQAHVALRTQDPPSDD